VERGVEHGHVRHALAEQRARGADALEVRGVVQRREVDAFLDAREHRGVDAHRLQEALAAVHDAVPDARGGRRPTSLLDPRVSRHDPAQIAVDRRAVVAQRRVLDDLGPARGLEP
jgi:hypothetical protein